MAVGAAEAKYEEIDEEEEERIKGLSAAVENYGNFYGQNVFIASGGVLLIVGTLQELGYNVTPLDVSKGALPIAIIAVIVASFQFFILIGG